jgi:UDP:flavonoid glycosyltransferase YjiC (YdhE family)
VPAIRALQSDPRNVLVVISPYRREIEAQTGSSVRSNVLFVEFLPYHLILPQLRLLITNGGHGSITQALSHGVPLLCAGQTEDTAARVSWAGAGIGL